MTTETITIEAGHSELHYWRDLWRYRELMFFLGWRDILVRYKQTAMGIAWSVLRPLATMAVFTIIFGRVAKLPSDGGAPYPILVFAAMLPWQFVSNAFAEAGGSLVANSSMVSKVYFPRIIVPISAVFVGVVDFLISSVLLLAFMVWYRFVPDARIVFLPLFFVLAFFTALGAGLWIAALNVRYRDFRFVIPFVVQFGLYVSPVGFSSSVIPERWRLIYSLNPMVGVIDGFRWSLLGGDSVIYWPGMIMSWVFVILITIGGIRYFRRTEQTLADVI